MNFNFNFFNILILMMSRVISSVLQSTIRWNVFSSTFNYIIVTSTNTNSLLWITLIVVYYGEHLCIQLLAALIVVYEVEKWLSAYMFESIIKNVRIINKIMYNSVVLYLISEGALLLTFILSTLYYANCNFIILNNKLALINFIILSLISVLMSYMSIDVLINYVSRFNMKIVIIFMIILFVFIQHLEFHSISFFINDNIWNCYMLMIIGIHYSHVIIGTLMLIPSYKYFNHMVKGNTSGSYLNVYTNYNNSFMVSMYWHYIELLWIFIYILFYYH